MIKFYRVKKLLVTLLLLACILPGYSQSRQVKGNVTSGDGSGPLPGVSVVEKGTNNGTVTDGDGNFAINVGDRATLVFSFVGYASQELSIGDQTAINLELQPDITALNEVVVIGYGEQKREDVTGAITSITSKDFNKGVMTSPTDLLLGKLAGVQVTSNSGAPWSGSTIKIRGGSSLSASNAPLIVIDNLPITNSGVAGASNPLASINPNDIESYTVLKDASATAIYGSRASNGVIIITTKKGASGKPKLNYDGKVSVSSPVKFMDVLSGDEYRDLITELANDPNTPVSGLNPSSLGNLGTENTDWQDLIYRNAISHDHNLSLSGTTQNLPYRVSYGYTDQQGILENTSAKRHSLNVNLNPTFLDDNLKVNVSAKGSNTENNFGNTGAVGAAIGFDPTQPVRNGNTRYGGYFTWTTDYDDPDSDPTDLSPTNPVALVDLADNIGNVNRLIGNIQLDYRLPFLPDMRANLNTGIDYQKSDGHNYTSTLAPWTTDANEGQKIDYEGEVQSKLFDFYLNYVKNLDAHKFDATAGYSYQNFENNGQSFNRNWNGTKFYDYELDFSDDADADGDTVARKDIPFINTLLSFFGRVHYTYDDRYLVTLTYRTDASSRFYEEGRWGSFPSVALAWNAMNEPFLQSAKGLTNLKVRLGYGITGQQDVGGSYPYLPVYQASTLTAQYQFGNQFYNTLRPNPYEGKIKWEETTTYNAGIDFGILNGKLSGTVDVYQRKTDDLLNFIQVPAGSAFSNYLTTNVGSLENKGIEITLNSDVLNTTDMLLNVGFNFTYNTNKITKLLKTPDPTYEGVHVGGISGGVGNTVQIHTVGQPVSSFYVFQQIYDDNGRPIEGLYVDRTGGGGSVVSNSRNKYHYHSPAPRYLMGLFSSLRYKQFDFYMSGRLSLDNYVYNNRAANTTTNSVYYNLGSGTGFFNNLANYIYDTDFVATQYWSDFYVENASFFKMDNISLGYDVTGQTSQRLKARVSFTVQNAFVITKYNGIDPEVDGGIDNNIYPRPRTFVLGVNLTY
jgi:TonB-dependent starch-binding outer membrane protein SusC